MFRSFSRKKYILCLTAILLLQLVLLFFFGTQKAGLHEDESFCYYSSNRTMGFYYPDREWVDTEVLKDEFRVLPGAGFNYSLVRLAQSWDEHPPLFYDLLHTACSLTPGVFSKWQGLAVNMIGFVFLQIMLAGLARELFPQATGRVTGTGTLTHAAGVEADPAARTAMKDRAAVFSLACVLVYGLCPALVSGVMFIRMYNWLTVFVLACAWEHVRLFSRIRTEDLRNVRPLLRLFACMTLTTLLGFLTQYYYILYLFFAGVVTFGFFITERRRRGGIPLFIAYGFSQGLGLFLSLLYFPYSVAHLFGGETSRGVAKEFFDVRSLLSRIGYFFRLLNTYAFEGLLPVFLAALLVMEIVLLIRQAKGPAGAAVKEQEGRGALLPLSVPCMFALTAAGFFFLISQTGLILSSASFRYLIPVCPMIMVLVLYGFYVGGKGILETSGNAAAGDPKDAASGTLSRLCAAGLAVLLALQLISMARGNVLFLYREDVPKLAFANEHRDDPVIIAYHPVTYYNIWFLTNEVFSYDEVFYMNGDDPSPLTDDRIRNAEELVVYLADSNHSDETLRMLEDLTGGKAEPMFHEEMWNTYLIR